MEPSSPEEHTQAQAERRTPNMGMGGAYDGDMPEMESSIESEGGNPAHYPNDAAMDTGRESSQPKEPKGESQERDPDMDTGNHARDVVRDMITPGESGPQPEMREPRRADHLAEDSDESDALPHDQDETAGIP